jgi:hypothetical protein
MYSVCGLTRHAQESTAAVQTDGSNRFLTTIAGLDGNEVYVFNVIALSKDGISSSTYVAQSVLVPSGSVCKFTTSHLFLCVNFILS